MKEVPITKIPMGVRTLPVRKDDDKTLIVNPDTCGKGEHVARHRHLDELDGDAFK